MAGCGCQQRARWLSATFSRLAARFDTQPALALAQLLTGVGLIAAAGYCYGASRSRSYATRARSALPHAHAATPANRRSAAFAAFMRC